MKSGTYEEKVEVLLDVIDYQNKGYLSWLDLKSLCKQSFSLCVDAQMTGLSHSDELTSKPLFTAESRKYVKNTEGGTFNSDDVEEEMSEFFADLMFERVTTGKASSSDAQLPPAWSKKPAMTQIEKEMQSVSIEDVRKLLMRDKESEESELFQLLCGFSTQIDPLSEVKRGRVPEDDEESVKLFYA